MLFFVFVFAASAANCTVNLPSVSQAAGYITAPIDCGRCPVEISRAYKNCTNRAEISLQVSEWVNAVGHIMWQSQWLVSKIYRADVYGLRARYYGSSCETPTLVYSG